ncbi:hypothetical protein Y032_0012g1904 [Ancylostoma ceylanicum]|uniref:NHL repeat protein n=1 Tax=Ancylostoma ceylanicum TaxID=53326 RepID=A0A016VDW2_9BILA|nr:hypothetical protein Y032_0012g1904 [Ancylostoma ceylanicum]
MFWSLTQGTTGFRQVLRVSQDLRAWPDVSLQVFTSDGEFICTFGTWGGGAGQLKGVEALCVSDGGVVASDRENHRIQIF